MSNPARERRREPPRVRMNVNLTPRRLLEFLDRSIGSWAVKLRRGDTAAGHYLDCLQAVRAEFFGSLPPGATLEHREEEVEE